MFSDGFWLVFCIIAAVLAFQFPVTWLLAARLALLLFHILRWTIIGSLTAVLVIAVADRFGWIPSLASKSRAIAPPKARPPEIGHRQVARAP